MGLVWLVLRHKNQMARLRRVHNDPLLVPHHTARTYFYSIDDRVVCWQDVESPAAYARAAGYTIALALFNGTLHMSAVVPPATGIPSGAPSLANPLRRGREGGHVSSRAVNR